MITVGIDPGSIICGYGVVEENGSRIHYITSGQISMPKKLLLSKRLAYLYDELTKKVSSFKPDISVIERVFYAKGYKAALNLGHARGVALLALTSAHIPVVEYSTLEVKKSVVGYGRAEKRQVLSMVQAILNIKEELSFDSADALALAICHLNSAKLDTGKSRFI